MMAILPLQRLYVMQCPLSSLSNASTRRKLGIWLSTGLWTILIALNSGMGFINGKQGVEFSIARFICQPVWLKTTANQGKIIRPLILILFQVTPLLTTSIANVWVLIICSRTNNPKKAGSQLKTKSVVTILIVTTLFLMSIFPNTVLMIIVLFNGGHKGFRPLFTTYIPGTVSMQLSFVNVVSNYYVLKFTGKRRGTKGAKPYCRSRIGMTANLSENTRKNSRMPVPMDNLVRVPQRQARKIRRRVPAVTLTVDPSNTEQDSRLCSVVVHNVNTGINVEEKEISAMRVDNK